MKKSIVVFLLVAASAFGQSAGVGSIWTVVSGTLQSAATANGDGTALAVRGLSAALLTVHCSVACTGGTTINFEISEDGTNYFAAKGIGVGTDSIATTVVNQNTTRTAWRILISGSQLIRARISAYSAGTITVTATATPGELTPPGIPACDSFFNINIVTATTTLMVTGVSGKHVRVCHIDMIAAAADNVGIISGTGATCGTGSAAIVGTTAATGYNFLAGAGISSGNGTGTIMRTVALGDSVCFITSAATQLSGIINYTVY